jgi:hypothetical protein
MSSRLRTSKYGKFSGIRVALTALLATAVLAPKGASAGEAELAALRQSCQSALEGTDQQAAHDTCQRAYIMGKSPEDLRHNVAALVKGQHTMTMSELAEASFKADVAVKIAPEQPWGYAARALLALKLGDRDVLDRALSDLKRVAPDHPETKRITAFAAAQGSMLATVGFWLLLVALLGTLGHALRSLVKPRQPPMRRAIIIIATLCALGASRGTARATTMEEVGVPGVGKIDPADPGKSIPTPEQQMRDPIRYGMLLQDMLAGAREAERTKDYATAANYYRALTKAVPTAYAPGRLCETLTQLGDPQGALNACREAVVREGVTVGDYDRLAGLLMQGPDPLPKDVRAELDGVVQHVKSHRGEGGIGAEQFLCRVGARFHDVGMLESCTEALARAGAKDPATLTFQWNLAMEKHNFRDARKIVDEARKTGMPENAVGMMDDATSALRRKWYRRAVAWLLGAVVAASLLRLAIRRYGLPGRRLAT